MPTPNNPMKYLNSIKITDVDKYCSRAGWNHRHETSQNHIRVECKYLKNVYPFVERNCHDDVCEESLRVGNKTVQIFKYSYSVK